MGRKQIFYCLHVEQYCMHILEEDEKGSAYQPPKCRDQNIDWLTKRWEPISDGFPESSGPEN